MIVTDRLRHHVQDAARELSRVVVLAARLGAHQIPAAVQSERPWRNAAIATNRRHPRSIRIVWASQMGAGQHRGASADGRS